MRTLTRMLLAVSLMTSLVVSAKGIQEFKETGGHTAEEIEAMKKNSKYQVNSWSGDVSQDVEPFPWMAAILALIVIGGVAPFAIRMYMNTSKEVQDANTFGASAGGGNETDE